MGTCSLAVLLKGRKDCCETVRPCTFGERVGPCLCYVPLDTINDRVVHLHVQGIKRSTLIFVDFWFFRGQPTAICYYESAQQPDLCSFSFG